MHPAGAKYEASASQPPRENRKYHRLNDSDYFPNFENIGPLLGLGNGHRYDVPQISGYIRFCKNSSSRGTFSREAQSKNAKDPFRDKAECICLNRTLNCLPGHRVKQDACFLGNAFITKHRKMHTLRTHGSLYSWLEATQSFADEGTAERIQRAAPKPGSTNYRCERSKCWESILNPPTKASFYVYFLFH